MHSTGYNLNKILGSGRWARVYQASVSDTRPMTRWVAIKVKSRKHDPLGYLEGILHSHLHHPHIVDIYGQFSSGDLDFLVLELCRNGTLLELLASRTTLTLFEVRRLTIQILGASKYVERKGYVHRDIKPANILLDDQMQPKLGDFGLADVVDIESPLVIYCGTSEYAAPEVIKPPPEGYSGSCDTWSIVVVMSVSNPKLALKVP